MSGGATRRGTAPLTPAQKPKRGHAPWSPRWTAAVRCWPQPGSSRLTARAHPPPQNQAVAGRRRPTQHDEQQDIQTTDCSDDLEVMAKQVKPWSAKPVPNGALIVSVSNRGAKQQNPSGTAPILIHAEASMKVSTYFDGGHHEDGTKAPPDQQDASACPGSSSRYDLPINDDVAT